MKGNLIFFVAILAVFVTIEAVPVEFPNGYLVSKSFYVLPYQKFALRECSLIIIFWSASSLLVYCIGVIFLSFG